MDFLLYFILDLAFLIVIAYYYFTSTFGYFERQGIPGPKPVPIFGTYYGSWHRKMHERMLDYMKKYGKIHGTFMGRTPCLHILDPNLIRAFTVRDFDNFADRRIIFGHEYFKKTLAFASGEEWKLMRQKATPAFTTARLRRTMEDVVLPFGEVLTNRLMDLAASKETRVADMKVEIRTFIISVMAKAGCSLPLDVIGKADHPIVVEAFKSMETYESVLMSLGVLYPDAAKYIIPRQAFGPLNFFGKIAKELVEQRKTMKVDDLIEGLLSAHKERYPDEKDDITSVAHIAMFISAGTETTATTIATLTNFFALHPHIQEKAREEMLKALRRHGGKINYDLHLELPYLEQCVLETLRMIPPASTMSRVCTKDTKYGDVFIKKGTVVAVPIYALHHDPEVYPDPETFDPNRFSSEGKANRDPATFLPFGYGPRNCIGMKFAIVQVKLVLCQMLTNLVFKKVEVGRDMPELFGGSTGLLSIGEVPLVLERLVPKP